MINFAYHFFRVYLISTHQFTKQIPLQMPVGESGYAHGIVSHWHFLTDFIELFDVRYVGLPFSLSIIEYCMRLLLEYSLLYEAIVKFLT